MAASARAPHLSIDTRRKVSWLELFYDLVYVATVVQLSNKLSEDVSWEGFFGFALLFIPIWWVWMGTTAYFSRFEADDLTHHMLIFAQILAVSALSLFVYDGLGETSAEFALAYAIARGILVVMYLRAGRNVEVARPLTQRYVNGFTISSLLWLVSAFVPEPFRFGLWIAGLLVDFYVVLSPESQRLQQQLPPNRYHLQERMGLFTLIVFGESFIKVIGGFSGLEIVLQRVLVAFLGLVVVGSLWWVYFENIAERAVDSIYRARLWLYTHLPLQVALIALAVGIYKLVTLHQDGLPSKYRLLICLSVAFALIAMSVIELCIVKRPEERAVRSVFFVRYVGAIMALAIGWLGGGLDELIVMLLLAAICFVQVLFDLYRLAGVDMSESSPEIEVEG